MKKNNLLFGLACILVVLIILTFVVAINIPKLSLYGLLTESVEYNTSSAIYQDSGANIRIICLILNSILLLSLAYVLNKILKKGQIKRCIIVIIVLAFLFGLLYSLMNVPLGWMDEDTHFARAIQLSNGDYMLRGEPKNVFVGGRIDSGEIDMINFFNQSKNDRMNLGFSLQWHKYFKIFSRNNKKAFYPTTNSVVNQPIVYFPYIIVGWLSSLFSIYPIIEVYLMRIFGLIVFMGINIYAICKTKKAKLPLALMLLSPTILLTYSSITADAYLFSISTLFFVTLFEKLEKVINGLKFTQKDYFEILIITILMSLCKLPSFLFIGLWLPIIFYALKKDSNKYKTFSIYTSLGVLVAAIITIVFFLSVKDLNTGAFWGRNTDTKLQIAYMLKNPIETIKVFIHSILNYEYYKLQIGYLRNQQFTIPRCVSVLFYIGIFLSALGKNFLSRVNLKKIKKYKFFNIFLYLSIAAYIFLVFLMLYLQFSEIGSNTIDGVQTRYFIPLFILMAINFAYQKCKDNDWIFIYSIIFVIAPIPFLIISQMF